MIDIRPLLDRPRSSGRLRVLFDCPGAWPVLCPEFEEGIGGAEVRAVTFARELARRGKADVHFLVRHAPVLDAQPAGITVHFESQDDDPANTTADWWSGARRFSDRLAESLATRWSGMPGRHRLLETLDYDVLCCFGVTNRTARLVRSARQAGRRVLVFLTSDRTLADIRLRGRRQRGAYGELGSLCRYSLQSADSVVVQTRGQQDTLHSCLGIQTRLIRNPIDLQTPPPAIAPRDLPDAPYALWVGRADTFSKRADRCWQLARKCPHTQFVAIMNPHDAETFRQLQLTQPANVTLIPHVRPQQIEAYYQTATLLINTSDVEGFPNSFLQAGKYGVPVLSLKVDPDGMLHRHDAGVCCHGSLPAMREHLLRLMQRGEDHQRLSRKARAYTATFHDLAARCDELTQAIEETSAVARAAA